VGYSSTEHLVISGSYTQQNVLGTGHAFGIQLNTSTATRTIALSHADPYVTIDGVSRSEEIYLRDSNLAALGLATVDIGTTGGTVRWGVPFTEFDTIFFGIGVEATTITLTQSSPYLYIDYVNRFGSAAGALLGTVGWSRDSRDNILTPERGRFQRAFLEVGTPVLDLQYYKLTYQYQQFQPLTNKFTLAFNGQAGYGGGYGGKEFPLFKNFYVGGIGSVRGFVAGTLGPRDINGNPLGGVKEVNGSLEALATLPGADRSLRGLIFLDGGNVWGSGEAIRFAAVRAAAGIGIAWISPIGPLKLSLAQPIRYQPTDEIQRFQFQIGTGF
jgi:outer membrane protein insertion porin family